MQRKNVLLFLASVVMAYAPHAAAMFDSLKSEPQVKAEAEQQKIDAKARVAKKKVAGSDSKDSVEIKAEQQTIDADARVAKKKVQTKAQDKTEKSRQKRRDQKDQSRRSQSRDRYYRHHDDDGIVRRAVDDVVIDVDDLVDRI